MTSSTSTMIEITLFTDPVCPFAFSAEPVRWRLRWHYGEQLRWRLVMIVLTHEKGEAEKLGQGAPSLQARYDMPIDPAPYPRASSSEPACRAVVAARLNAPRQEERLLRRLRVLRMAGGLLDDPGLIATAAREAGIAPDDLHRWTGSEAVEVALQADIAASRSPSPAARALDHKLGGPRSARRYTAPSYELSNAQGDTFSIPGFNPVEAYETAIASLAPELVRREPPSTVAELLSWAAEPLATAEVIEIMGLDSQQARAALARVAHPIASGADFYWQLAAGEGVR